MFRGLGEIRIGKKAERKIIIKLLVILPSFKRCTSRYSGLDSFLRRLLAVEEGVFGCPGWILSSLFANVFFFIVTVSLGSSDKDQDIQGRMKRKRKKCSDQDKAGELN